MRTLFFFSIIFSFVVFASWFVNVFKLTNCDFVAPYKCEAIHGIGIVPVISVVTAWFDIKEGT